MKSARHAGLKYPVSWEEGGKMDATDGQRKGEMGKGKGKGKGKGRKRQAHTLTKPASREAARQPVEC